MADNLWSGWVTPDLARNPALAADVYKSTNPALVAPVASHTVRTVGVQDAINDHADTNGTQTFWSRLGHGVLTGAEWLSKPLKEIQRDYKFTHAVYVDHGFLPGFAVTLGVIGGGVAGTFLAGPVGTKVGADLAASGLRKLSTVGPWKDTYKDSYAKSEDENYKVSAGRDFSNLMATASDKLGAEGAAKAFRNTDKGIGKVISGTGDLSFDISADPVMLVGKFGQLMRGGKYLELSKAGELQVKYPMMKVVPGVKDFLASRSKVPLTSEQMDAVRIGAGPVFNAASRTYNRAIEDIAQSTAGEIAVKYPMLGTAAAGRLGELKTADEVHDFLKTALYFGEMEGNLAGQAMLPSRTLLRSKLSDSKVADYLRNGEKIPSRVYQTFTGYMPYSVDAQTLKLSEKKFRWNAPDAPTVIYRIARFGMGHQAALEMAGKYAEAVVVNNKGLARQIKNHTILESFKALGLPDDHLFVKNVMDDINKISEPVVGTQIYGVSPLGKNIGEYKTAAGPKVGGIVSHHARDMFDIPDFMAIKKAVRDAGKYKKHVGQIDEWVTHWYTNKVFKPLALATTGFGLRVAAAEIIPTFARFGVFNTFKAKLATAAAKANYDLTPGEAKHILPAAMSALGIHMGLGPEFATVGWPAFQEAKRKGLNFAAKMLPDEQMELATRLIIANQGHLLSEAVSTGHGTDASTAYQMNQAAHYYYQIQKNTAMFKDLPEYTTYSASDIHYVPRYVNNINVAANEAAHKNISADAVERFNKFVKTPKAQLEDDIDKLAQHKQYLEFRDSLIASEYDRMMKTISGQYEPYKKELDSLTRWSDVQSSADVYTFAADRVDATLGMFIGKDGTFLRDIAENISNGTKSDLKDISERISANKNSFPAAVAGPMLQPYVDQKGWISKLTDLGFRKAIDPIINGLAREPLYMMHVAEAYGRLIPQITAKRMTEDQALRIAQTQASYSMLPQIHNTALRNQFAQLARNFLPFYFAQEQALRRAYNTLKDTSYASPVFSSGIRFYQLAEHALSDPGFMQEDDNGNKYIYLPGVGALGESFQGALAAYGIPMVTGLPISAKGSTISLKSVLPELQTPGVSPFVAVSGNLIADLFPATKPIVKGTIGDISYQRGFWDTVNPATWSKSLWAAITPNEQNKALANATASALAAAYYHGQVPGPDATEFEQQAFVDRIRNNARSVLLVKAALNLISPLAPRVEQEDPGFRDEFWKLVKEKGNYADALLEFMGKHGDRAISYTVSKTSSTVPGAKYPYIQQTVDFIKQNKDKFDYKSGVVNGYFFLIPQDNAKNESDREVYNDLVSMHLREQRSPEELLKQFYIAAGDAVIANDRTIHNQIITAAKANFDTYAQKEENDRWSSVMTKMKNLYPIWYKDYTNGEGKINAQTAYNQLQQIFANPNTEPKHEQAKMVKALMGDYQRHAEIMSEYDMLGIQGYATQDEVQNWQNYLMALAENEPRLKSVINSVFMKLG